MNRFHLYRFNGTSQQCGAGPLSLSLSPFSGGLSIRDSFQAFDAPFHTFWRLIRFVFYTFSSFDFDVWYFFFFLYTYSKILAILFGKFHILYKLPLFFFYWYTPIKTQRLKNTFHTFWNLIRFRFLSSKPLLVYPSLSSRYTLLRIRFSSVLYFRVLSVFLFRARAGYCLTVSSTTRIAVCHNRYRKHTVVLNLVLNKAQNLTNESLFM